MNGPYSIANTSSFYTVGIFSDEFFLYTAYPSWPPPIERSGSLTRQPPAHDGFGSSKLCDLIELWLCGEPLLARVGWGTVRVGVDSVREMGMREGILSFCVTWRAFPSLN